MIIKDRFHLLHRAFFYSSKITFHWVVQEVVVVGCEFSAVTRERNFLRKLLNVKVRYYYYYYY